MAAALFAPAGLASRSDLTEVVVTLEAPPLARAIAHSRVLTTRARRQRLDLRAPTSRAYLRDLAATQRALAARIARTIPVARVTWRYRVVLNGLAVLLPRSALGRLAAVPGVAKVWPSLRYRPLLDRSPKLIGADQLWGSQPPFPTAGNGIKIGIVDDGVDRRHRFLDPSAFTMPPGFPKGDTSFTTAKVIAARAFAPPTTDWKYARRPFDPAESEHGTHVAGIAAGNYLPGAIPGRAPLSGVAPMAYIGNYKVLTVPTESFGLNGNSPEIAAGIEAAVLDGMDVINLSLGEPEIEPSRDLVVNAIDAAADAGVVPAIAAGNDFEQYGRGTVSSPGSAPQAITAAAVSKRLVVASFSSAGPTPISLQMKPDVSAPGVEIVSSVPPRAGTWASFSGTSMAAPHVAGAAALLRQRHPDWTVAEIKSALVTTGRPVVQQGEIEEAPTSREGGGLIDLLAANAPGLFAAPSGLSFGFVRPGETAQRATELADAGGGAGTWSVSVAPQGEAPGVQVTAPATVTVPGHLDVAVAVEPTVPEREVTGFVVLRLGDLQRRVPFWLRIAAPRLAEEPFTVLRRTGTYRGQTKGKPALVASYRYPDSPARAGVPNTLAGPEQVFRVVLSKPVANFGVAVTEHSPGVSVWPRVVVAGNENRLTGNAALPLAINPYLETFGTPRPISGAIRPAAGAYDVVFDTRTGAAAGPFTFRFWVDDATPPRVRLLTPRIGRRTKLALALTDGAAGVDPTTLEATVDGDPHTVAYSAKTGRALIGPLDLPSGRHRLVFQVSDYQEAKNMENVTRILPNTRVLRATFVVG